MVKIVVSFPPGIAKASAYGTGWVIERQGSRGLILTNRHVVIDQDGTGESGNPIEVELYSNLPSGKVPRRLPAQLRYKTNPDDPIDLAILEVDNLPSDVQRLPISRNGLDSGKISVIGHPSFPGSPDWAKDDGEIIGPNGSNLLITEVTLSIGSSGSPVLDLQTSEVVGVIFSTVTAEQGRGTTAGAGIAYTIDVVMQKLKAEGVQIPSYESQSTR